LGFLRRNLKYSPKNCKKTADITLVRSILDYGGIIWDPYLKTDVDRLEVPRSAYNIKQPGSSQVTTKQENQAA
jgi:hypothetical protein